MVDLLKLIRNVPDFPIPGIQFKDITTLVHDKEGFKESCDKLAEIYKNRGITKVVGIEARGYIFGSVVAYLIGAGFVLIRKPGKLPAETYEMEYSLEYGTNKIEIHKDSIAKGEKVLIVDDLLATGGTAIASARLIEKAGGIVEEMAFVIELSGSLKGREAITKAGYKFSSLLEIPVDE
ncbi:Adenine phosphoribosyltransferase [Candidatus Lokiarchaeum ossiferum]|uniref:Adenine phosphoribosyltransferase n=1 Tax=Candidatus Lokiarchaeum ossiferum TaxID=2951803 RepID=A0ABY6HSH9_9ARCH|nr:Adenine phosphoribosyltransferase [Candidatus Lokiarchaeum sp. B-35]